MSIKTTRYLTREAAERFYVELRLEEMAALFECMAKHTDSRTLGNRLDQLTDQQAERNGVTNFNNYYVTGR